MRKVLFIFLGGIFAISTIFAEHQRDEKAPFIILRMMNSSSENFDYMKGITDVFGKYPKTFDEVWLCTMAYYPSIKVRKDDSRNYLSNVCKLWQDIGIIPSFQVGTTLGHGNNNRNDCGFSKDAYRLRPDGTRMNMLCASSSEVRDYFYKHTLALINNAPLGSIWLDDDFRIGIRFTDLCFCKICLDKFNAQERSNWNVKDLSQALFGDNQKNVSLRKAWIKSQEQSLCELAEIVAKARDDASRKSVLGLQSINPHRYNCHNFPAIITAFANGKKAGIRIGSGGYSEFDDNALFAKMLGVMFETERCLKQNDIYQICYEAENYPHVSTIKTPRAMMLECAIMLASGCDSLALYWDDVKYPEQRKSHETFARVVREYRPFFEKIGNFYKGTRLWGIGRFIGETMYVSPTIIQGGKYIESRPEEQEFDLMKSAIPVVSTGGYADVVLLTDNTIDKLSDVQIEQALSKKCIVEATAIEKLYKRGFDFGVKATQLKAGEIFGGNYSERHKMGDFSMLPSRAFYNLEISTKNAKIVSDVISSPDKNVGGAFVVVETKQGGKLFVIGGNRIYRYFSAFRRSAFMDALDLLSPMPVRLETNHSMLFIPRVDKEGIFSNALIYNFTKGETDELILRVRSKSPQKYRLIRAKQADVVIESVKAEDSDGYILTLPTLAPVSICALELIK